MKRDAERLSLDGDGDADGDGEGDGDEAADDDDGRAKKKRRTIPGSRGVANLTPEQLAKKRANGECLLPSDHRAWWRWILGAVASLCRRRRGSLTKSPDREAQRAIRHRTKNQIETLERRIEELTSLKPYQELQAVVRAKEAVEHENAEIKRQLAAVIGILKPIIGEGEFSSSTSRCLL